MPIETWEPPRPEHKPGAAVGMRGRVAVHRENGETEHSPWSPYQLGTQNFGLLFHSILTDKPGDVDVQQVTDGGDKIQVYNGAKITFQTWENAEGQTEWSNVFANADDRFTWARVGWGDDGSGSASISDDDISSKYDEFNAGETSLDTSNGTLTVSGSSAYGGSPTTVENIGYYLLVNSNNGTDAAYHYSLMDHTYISGPNVSDGDTVQVTYEISW
jgi:hypothetical protein